MKNEEFGPYLILDHLGYFLAKKHFQKSIYNKSWIKCFTQKPTSWDQQFFQW